MELHTFIESERFTKIVIGVGLALAALLIFEAGMYVGVRKAEVSSRTGQNFYYRVFGPEAGVSVGAFGEGLQDANGAAGKILSVNLPTFMLEDAAHGEKIVSISGKTAIMRLRDATSSSAIRAGDFAIVIGEPDGKGQVQATFIRLLPPPPAQ
jgi:hypothetical protein